MFVVFWKHVVTLDCHAPDFWTKPIALYHQCRIVHKSKTELFWLVACRRLCCEDSMASCDISSWLNITFSTTSNWWRNQKYIVHVHLKNQYTNHSLQWCSKLATWMVFRRPSKVVLISRGDDNGDDTTHRRHYTVVTTYKGNKCSFPNNFALPQVDLYVYDFSQNSMWIIPV